MMIPAKNAALIKIKSQAVRGKRNHVALLC
jgi:hypothetical protein